MTIINRKFIRNAVFAICICAGGQTRAQEAAGPSDMPPEIAKLFADAGAQGGEYTVAPSEQPPNAGIAEDGDTLAGSRYLYSTLRVTTSGSNRGCGVSDWNCMTNLCKADLADQSAWRGWAGCWRDGNNFICYFECGQARNAF